MLDNLKRVAGVRGKEPCHVLGTIERCRIRQDAAEEFDKAICLSSDQLARRVGGAPEFGSVGREAEEFALRRIAPAVLTNEAEVEVCPFAEGSRDARNVPHTSAT